MKKFALIILIVVAIFLILSFILSASNTEVPERYFSLEELSEFDGKKGRPAYVAIDGIVYDVSGFGKWSGGKHYCDSAGKDLSKKLRQAPHGMGKLRVVPAVGKLKK